MNPRTTGILALIALLLGGFVYFYEIRGGERREEAAAEAKRLFAGVEATGIEWLELRTSDDRDARLERVDGAWRLVEPLSFPADPLAADGVAEALAALTSDGVIEDPRDLEIYGLGDTAQRLRFGAEGDEAVAVRVGGPTPVGSSTYVAVEGRDPVYTVETFSIKSLDRSLDALREGRPLRFDRDTVDRIEVRWRDDGVVLERDGEGWRLREPREERADDVTVDTLLSDLTFLDAEGFLDDPDPVALGFDDPDYTVTLRTATEGASEEHRLVFGGPAEEGVSRALRGSEASAYAIDEQRYLDLPRELVAFRYKQLADYPGTDVERFELLLRQEDSDETLLVTGALSDGQWTTEPERMAPGAPARMVSALSALRAKDIIADQMGAAERRALKLEPANAELRIYAGEARGGELLAEIRLGTIAAGVLYAQVPGREAVYGLESDSAQDVPVSLEAFRNRFVSKDDDSDEGGDGGEAPAPAS